MKFDMHCHTKEGSIDAKVPIASYIKKLISMGFDGMLVTDHNSYDGFRQYEFLEEMPDDFVVLKGIEYDTRNAGHVLVILPDGAESDFLEVRGMTIAHLEKKVHRLGGVLGLAHPYSPGYFAYTNTNFGRKNMDFINKIDFIEAFNACSTFLENSKSKQLAERFNKVLFGGSDAHKEDIAGLGYTVFRKIIRCNNDLIAYIKEGIDTEFGGIIPIKKQQGKNIIIKKLAVAGYWIYNKIGALVNIRKIRKINK